MYVNQSLLKQLWEMCCCMACWCKSDELYEKYNIEPSSIIQTKQKICKYVSELNDVQIHLFIHSLFLM